MKQRERGVFRWILEEKRKEKTAQFDSDWLTWLAGRGRAGVSIWHYFSLLFFYIYLLWIFFCGKPEGSYILYLSWCTTATLRHFYPIPLDQGQKNNQSISLSVPFQLVLSAISILQHSYRPPTLTRFYSEIYLPSGSVEDPRHLLARSTVLPEHPGNRVSYSCELYPTVDGLWYRTV